jgi:hypothetical protein
MVKENDLIFKAISCFFGDVYKVFRTIRWVGVTTYHLKIILFRWMQ